jgi:hypothetical protein
VSAIPHPWVAVVLALAAYRLTRLAGWDQFPLAVVIRAQIVGQTWEPVERDDGEPAQVEAVYSRPTLAHLFGCPFCLGWWISLATWLAWYFAPNGTLYVAAPFALAGAVSLVAKNLDP